MESMVLFAASIVDREKSADVRLEAALCKLWATERAWQIANDAMQIRGGRGYETAQSLSARGEEAVPVERLLRDSRINTIFEGSSEIMRLFIAREALDPHLKIGAPTLNSQLAISERVKSAVNAAGFYAKWYPQQWFRPLGAAAGDGFHPVLARHMRFAANASHRLARRLFHSMAQYGPKLEREQVLLGRFVDIGAEIFAIATSCARAQMMMQADEKSKLDSLSLADYFCRSARLHIDRLFHSVKHNVDRRGYKLAQRVLTGEFDWLETGIV
jgi:acyl-CoA dehydrogenase-like protein/ACAD9/ACADV-like protein